MRLIVYACTFILFTGFFQVAFPFGSMYPFSLSDYEATDATDPFDAYKKHVDGIRDYMNALQIEPVSFPVAQDASSGVTFIRKGLLIVRPNALGTVIICHGYTHSKHEASFFRTLFPHFNVLAFDFRAHGELTDGQFSTIGRDEMYDVKGAVDFVKTHPTLAGKPIIGFGFSMGAVSLLQAQGHFKDLFDLLILDSPFDSSSDCMGRCIDKMLTYKLFGKKYTLPGRKLILKSLYNQRLRPIVKVFFRWATGMSTNVARTKFVPVIPIEKAREITVPCFFVSCENDNKVTVDCVRRLYDEVSSPYKRQWVTQGMKHCGSCLAQPELYAYKLNKFIKTALDDSWTEPAKIRDDRVIIQTL
jgi:pimeloyl-ACP methyl ester carboxylesterase